MMLFAFTGCETTAGTKRLSGSNTEHTVAKLKHVTVQGNLTIGGAEKTSSNASQGGLGEGSLSGNQVDPQAVGESVKDVADALEPIEVPEVVIPEDKPLELGK